MFGLFDHSSETSSKPMNPETFAWYTPTERIEYQDETQSYINTDPTLGQTL